MEKPRTPLGAFEQAEFTKVMRHEIAMDPKAFVVMPVRLLRRSYHTRMEAFHSEGDRLPANRQDSKVTDTAAYDADVIVVGAGFSGMVAAYKLFQQHRSVIVVDAMDRVGGRSWTMNLSDGTFLDIGAGWTGSTEHHILRLVKELGLEVYTQYGLGEGEGQNLFVNLDGRQTFFEAVREISQDETGVTVVSARRTLRGRRAIVAIPTCLTGLIRFQPPLPADRALLIQRTPQGSAMKVQLVYDRAFWREPNFNGSSAGGFNGNSFAINGSVVPQTLDAGGPKGKNEPGILGCFIDDDAARDLGRLSQAARRARILQELVPRVTERVLDLSKKIEPNYIEFISQDLEWARGDYASTPGPGVLTASGFGPALREPVKRVHWAGVDTATIWYRSTR